MIKINDPVPYVPTDPDAPVPYRARVATASLELRTFVVPRLGIRPAGQLTRARRSEPRLRVA